MGTVPKIRGGIPKMLPKRMHRRSPKDSKKTLTGEITKMTGIQDPQEEPLVSK
jgi:adenylylsulfate kinase-like enzyme